jgi:hypothetical protein
LIGCGVGNEPPILRQFTHPINGEGICRLIHRRYASAETQTSTTEVIDVLPSVNRAREPVRLVAVTVPRIAEGVAIHHGSRLGCVGLDRLG